MLPAWIPPWDVGRAGDMFWREWFVAEDGIQYKDLTKRERQVLCLIASGKSGKEVAYKLGISFRTFVSHRFRIGKKLSAHNTADLTRAAVRMGLVPIAVESHRLPTSEVEPRQEVTDQLHRHVAIKAEPDVGFELDRLRNQLDDSKLRCDFAYNFLREVEVDGVIGPEYEEAQLAGLRAIVEALTEYTKIQELFISAVHKRFAAARMAFRKSA